MASHEEQGESKRPQLSLADAADRLGITRRQAFNRAVANDLPGSWRLGDRGSWRVDECTFEAWRRAIGDPNALPAEHFDCHPLPFKTLNGAQGAAQGKESVA